MVTSETALEALSAVDDPPAAIPWDKRDGDAKEGKPGTE